MMNKKIVDFDLDFLDESTEELPLQERFEKVIAAWESDFDSFEKLDEEIDLESEMFYLLNAFENKNLISDIEKLDLALRCQKERYEKCSKFIAQTLIPLYLAEDLDQSKEDNSRIEKHLEPFCNDPVDFSEILFEILNKLIFYEKTSMAVDLCKKTYSKIANSDNFYGNPEEDLAEVIVWDKLQEELTIILISIGHLIMKN